METAVAASDRGRDAADTAAITAFRTYRPRLAGGTIPFIRRYSTIWP
jgi:hypothetical protein